MSAGSVSRKVCMKKNRFQRLALLGAFLAVSGRAMADTNVVDIGAATTYYSNTGTAILTALFAIMLGFIGLRWLGKLGGRK